MISERRRFFDLTLNLCAEETVVYVAVQTRCLWDVYV